LWVKHVSFSIAKGEMLAVGCESGSGKSLTALSCLGLQPAGAAITGSIKLSEQEIIGASDQKLRTIRGTKAAMIFQEPMTALNPLHTMASKLASPKSRQPSEIL